MNNKNIQILIDKYKNTSLPVKASFWYIACTLIQRGIQFVTTPLFSRLMTTEQYGQVTVYNSWIEILTIFCTLNLFYGVYNVAITKNMDKKDEITSSMLSLCTFCTLIVFGIYWVFKDFINLYSGMTSELTIVMFIQILFLPAFNFWSARLRYDYDYRKLVICTLIVVVTSSIASVIAVVISDNKGYARIITNVVISSIVYLFLYISIIRKGHTTFNAKFWSYAFRFNLPLVPHYLSTIILSQSDRIMIDNMCGTDYAGIYGLTYTVGALAAIFTQAVMNSFTPFTYQSLKNDNYDKLKNISSFLVMCSAVVSFILVLIAPELIWILGGEKYKEGVWVIAPVAMSIFFSFLYSLYANIEFYFEKNIFIMLASIIAAGLNVFLNYVFINKFGFVAAGYTTLVCYMVYAFAHYLLYKRILKIKGYDNSIYDGKFTIIVMVILLLFGFSTLFIYDYVIIRYLLFAVILLIAIINKKKLLTYVAVIRGKKNEI